MASGASGVAVAPESDDELRLGEALDALLRRLALLIVRDGEGAGASAASRSTAADQPTVARVARAVADSPLVKAALHGGDPNWGRIAQAVGAALPDTAPLALDVWIEDVHVCAAGAAVPPRRGRAGRRGGGDEVEYTRRARPARAPRPSCSSPTSRTST